MTSGRIDSGILMPSSEGIFKRGRRLFSVSLRALECIEEALTPYFREGVTGRPAIPWLGMARSALKTSSPCSGLFAACEAEVLQAGIIIHNKRNLGLLALGAIRANNCVALFHSDPLDPFAKVAAGAAWSEFIRAFHPSSFRIRFR